MADRSAIEWTDATWNPVTGCTKVSPGCDHCYAEAITNRFKRGPFEQVRVHPKRLEHPYRWKAPRRIFVNSMSDLFHRDIPEEFFDRICQAMAHCQRHTFQILTKRPGRINWRGFAYRDETGFEWKTWPDNVWLGTSVELQKYAPRLDVLAQVPAKVRFVSAEPLLGPLDLTPWLDSLAWVIAGGESGAGHRLMNYNWVRSLRDQCHKTGTAFFFKQGSAYKSGQDRYLDGRTWDEYPDRQHGGKAL